jgi:TPR repeat protein
MVERWNLIFWMEKQMAKLLFLSFLFSGFFAVNSFAYSKNLSHFAAKKFKPSAAWKTSFANLSESAESGNIKAQYFLGRHYLELNPAIKNNRIRAKKWLKKAFTGGYAPAGFELSLSLINQGPKERAEAVKLLESPALRDEPFSQYLLSDIYYQRARNLEKEAGKQGIDWAAYIAHESNILNPDREALNEMISHEFLKKE